MLKHRTAEFVLGIGLVFAFPLSAHVGPHPSVHDTVAGIVERFATELPEDALLTMRPAQAIQCLTETEREILATQHITFRVNQPAAVTVLCDADLPAPFWLADRGFKKSPMGIEEDSHRFEAWRSVFAPGEVGLGVNSITGGGDHYFVVVEPVEREQPLVIDQLYPGQLRIGEFKEGTRPYVDRDEAFSQVPTQLAGQTIVRTARAQRDASRLLGVYRTTSFPSSTAPDHTVLTWSDDPKRTQTVQWRTSTRTKSGRVRYREKPSRATANGQGYLSKAAATRALRDRSVLNDPRIHWHTAVVRGLRPGTTYTYQVGDGTASGWSAPSEFTTAPEGAAPFSFIYMGDAQNGLDHWGELVQRAEREQPQAAFYLLAGDLVNRGNERDDWDSFFHYAEGAFSRRPLVPVIGNHECQGGRPRMYLDLFTLPRNGPPKIEAERAYAFEYANALFVILDSNASLADQTDWLEAQLANSNATWKFVSYHHPAYASAPRRDNRTLRRLWTPLFDKYHVDLALQGHDHAYLRTYPMNGEQTVGSPAEGTVYIVSVSGTKMYDQSDRKYTQVGMTDVSTYQILDLRIDGDELRYRAYDREGKLRDEFVIRKRPGRGQ